MEKQSVAVVMCDFRCHPKGLFDSSLFSDQDNVYIIENLCSLKEVDQLPELRGTKVIFGGCPLINTNGVWHKFIDKFRLKPHEYRIIDVKTELVDRYRDEEGIEANLRRRIGSLEKILSRTRPLIDNVIRPNRKVFIFGSGLSALTAALMLAEEDIALDIEDVPEELLSPGCLGELFRDPNIMKNLKRKAEDSDYISFLPPETPKLVTAIDEGFIISTEKGSIREYGTIVFAPERNEAPNQEIGTFNLTELIMHITSGYAWSGETVFFLDHKINTPPEIFGDVLHVALHLREILNLEVTVLMQNARISFPGLEELYDSCRDAGIVFIKYSDAVLDVNAYSDYTLSYVDKHTKTDGLISNPTNLIIPGRSYLSQHAKEFAQKLKLQVFDEDFLQPDSLWRFPNETNRSGIFVAGPSRMVMDARTIYEDATALVFNMRERLSPEGIEIEENIPVVDKEKCAYCLTCIRACPFGATVKNIEERTASVIRPACKSCGICVAECPAGALSVRNMDDTAINEGIRALV